MLHGRQAMGNDSPFKRDSMISCASGWREMSLIPLKLSLRGCATHVQPPLARLRVRAVSSSPRRLTRTPDRWGETPGKTADPGEGWCKSGAFPLLDSELEQLIATLPRLPAQARTTILG